MQKHAAKCTYRRVPCDLCSESTPFFWLQVCKRICILSLKYYLQEHHASECENAMIDCPYKCDDKTVRKDLQEHEKVCPCFVIECPIEGCESKVLL